MAKITGIIPFIATQQGVPITAAKFGPGKGNQGRGGAAGHMASRWTPINTSKVKPGKSQA